MSKTLTIDDILNAFEKTRETSKDVSSFSRIVSQKEYNVLKEMGQEKIDKQGYPKAEFFEEYVKLMSK